MWGKLKQQIWQWRVVLIAAPSVAVLIIALRTIGLWQMFELAALDQFFRLRPKEPIDDRIVIVDIAEADIRKIKRWPISDADLVKLIKNIKAQKPKAIGLDLYRDLPVEPGHQQLVQLFQTTPNLFGIRKVGGESSSDAVSPPPALKYIEQVGANDFPLDPDGKVRRFFISIPIKKEQQLYTDETFLDSLSVKISLKYLQDLGITPEVVNTETKTYKLGKAILNPFVSNDGGYAQAYDGGYQSLLNYRGNIDSFHHISMSDVLANQISPNLMRDRIVLIGASAVSLNDLLYTPYSSSLLTTPERMPGVVIQANAIAQIINSAIDGRPIIKFWSDYLEWIWILGWSILGATLTWIQRQTRASAKGTVVFIVSVLIANIALVYISYLAFLNSFWVPVVPALIAFIGATLSITAYIAKSAGEIRKTFGRYLTDQVVANLLETPGGLNLGGERKKVTIMMTDLRGFSAVSEILPPEIVVSFLNIYLGAMADIITYYNGTIDEFIGDAILVIFGAPTQGDDDAQRAVACAIAMQLEMDTVNQKIKQFNMPKLEMGIGINTGEVVVGNIGSEKRAKYGIVGSHVNLTGRIESYTVGGQILISEYTFKEAEQEFQIKRQIQVEPKGIKNPITLYEIAGVKGKYNISLPETKDKLLALSKKIPLCYTVLDGKHVIGTVFHGNIVKLSESGAELEVQEPLTELSNIKITLLTDTNNAKPVDSIYAKVTNKITTDNTNFYIRFTALPPEAAAIISNILNN